MPRTRRGNGAMDVLVAMAVVSRLLLMVGTCKRLGNENTRRLPHLGFSGSHWPSTTFFVMYYHH